MFFDIFLNIYTFCTPVTYKFCIFPSIFYITEKYKIELFFLDDVVNL